MLIDTVFMWLPDLEIKKKGDVKPEQKVSQCSVVEVKPDIEMLKLELDDKKSKREFVAKMFGSAASLTGSLAATANLSRLVGTVLNFEQTGIVTTMVGKNLLSSMFKKP